jgi:hypothetical protein
MFISVCFTFVFLHGFGDKAPNEGGSIFNAFCFAVDPLDHLLREE